MEATIFKSNCSSSLSHLGIYIRNHMALLWLKSQTTCNQGKKTQRTTYPWVTTAEGGKHFIIKPAGKPGQKATVSL